MGDEWGMALCLEGMAQVVAAQPGPLAIHLFAAADTWRAANRSPVPPRRADYERALEQARAPLGPARFAAEWALGARMTLDQAYEAALTLQPTEPASREASDGVLLSPRELQVAALVARGETNRQIAQALGISKTTVDRHVSNILVKGGFASRAQVAAWVARREVA